MKPVIDKDGNIIDGLYRSEMGHLVINDKTGHTKYVKAKQAIEEVDNLKKQLFELTEKVATLMIRESNQIALNSINPNN